MNEPWRFACIADGCDSRNWDSFPTTEEPYRCHQCGNRSKRLLDKKTDELVEPGYVMKNGL